MVAAPQYATASFVGASGRVYTIDVYASDVANAAVNWSPSGAAGTGTLTYWQCPEDCTLFEFSINTGMTDTKGLIFTEGGAVKAGTAIRYANQLNTLNNRPRLTIKFGASALIGANQF